MVFPMGVFCNFQPNDWETRWTTKQSNFSSMTIHSGSLKVPFMMLIDALSIYVFGDGFDAVFYALKCPLIFWWWFWLYISGRDLSLYFMVWNVDWICEWLCGQNMWRRKRRRNIIEGIIARTAGHRATAEETIRSVWARSFRPRKRRKFTNSTMRPRYFVSITMINPFFFAIWNCHWFLTVILTLCFVLWIFHWILTVFFFVDLELNDFVPIAYHREEASLQKEEEEKEPLSRCGRFRWFWHFRRRNELQNELIVRGLEN